MMVQVIEAVYSKGKLIAEDVRIPDNSKVLIIWDPSISLVNSEVKNKKSLPVGIILNKNEGQNSPLSSFPKNAVEFQRTLRDEEWN